MQDLKYWKQKIKNKRKNTDFRDFIREVASWIPLSFNKNNGLISRFPDTQRVNICSGEEFEQNRDSLIDLGNNYDFSKNFHKNFSSLFTKIKLPPLFHYGNNEGCKFADVVLYSKNAYLSNILIGNCENVFYSTITRNNSKNIFNSLFSVEYDENVYFSLGTINSFNVYYSTFVNNSNNIWFSSNLNGCSECLFCNNLDNVSYYINNKKYSKEDYLDKKEELLKDKFKFHSYLREVNRVGKNSGSTNVNGSYILDSEDIENGNFVYNSKDARNVFFIGSEGGNNNFYDVIPGGGGKTECSDYYGVCGAGDGSSNLYCSSQIGSSTNIFYSYYIEACSYCIGCIGLKNKSYCILNKQYTKKQWETLADKIFSQMENSGLLGEFFPGNLNPFNFNDTMAGNIGNFSKAEAEKYGYMWRNDEIKVDIPENSDIISSSSLNNFEGYNEMGEWKIDPEILKKVIKDKNGHYYKIVQKEFEFLEKHSLPLPDIHWMDRMKINLGVKSI